MILMHHIIREGHPTLTQKAKPLTFPLSKEYLDLGRHLLEYVQNSQNDEMVKKYKLRPSVGLAAPQVNKSVRMFAMHIEDFDGTLYSHILINPEIIGTSKEETYIPGGEGCLSVDRTTEGITPRHLAIKAKAFQLNLETNQVEPIELMLQGYPAIVFQHEYDHLEGILFTEKLYKELPHAIPLFETDDTQDEASSTE